jgi:hypothetical protein
VCSRETWRRQTSDRTAVVGVLDSCWTAAKEGGSSEEWRVWAVELVVELVEDGDQLQL